MSPGPMRLARLLALALCLAVEGTAPADPAQPASPLEARPFFFALSVGDVEASAEWYGRVLGFRADRSIDLPERGARIRLLRREGAFLELVEDAGSRDPTELDPGLTRRVMVRGVFKIGFEVENLEATVSRLDGLGVSLRGNVITEPDGSMRSAQIEDPDGNAIQLFESLVERGITTAGLHYEVTGEGRPLVLLHGFSLDRRMWNREAAALASGYRVVRYDLRGHGLSAEWSEPFTAHEDLLSVYAALGLERAVLVGLSAGAEVAIDFALAYPERVSALFLASPGLGGYQPQGSFEWLMPTLEALRDGDPREAARRWSETPILHLDDPDRATAVRQMVSDNWRIWTFNRELQGRPDPPAIDRLGEIAVPTTVVVGEKDLPDTHHVADLLVERIPGAKKLTLPSAGHLVNLAAPDPFETALRRFLSDLPAAP